MGRMPCCEKDSVKRGQWTPEEDAKLITYVKHHGTRNWRLIPKHAGLQRCGKSCRLRWTNYLRPDLKHGDFTDEEEHIIVKLHAILGNRWSMIAQNLPGRTDNDVKNHWNTKMKKKLSNIGIDPVTHKPFSHLMAEIASTFAPPQVAHLAEAALGCFKDEMLHLLTKKRLDHIEPLPPPPPHSVSVAAAAAEIRVPDYPDSSSSSSSLTSQSSVLYDAQRMSTDVAGNFGTPQSQRPPPPPPPRMNFADAAVSAGCAIFPFGSPSSSSWYGNPLNTDADNGGGVVVVTAGNDCDSSDGSDDAVASASAAAATFFGSDSALWDLSDDFIDPLP